MNATRLNELDAWQAARALARRELRAQDLVRACLDRVAARDAEVRAFVHLDPDAALAQARALDAGPLRGPLHGLPLGVKDLFNTADMPITYGSPIYAGHRPAADAAAVALCREAGALVLGKTVSTEFAYFQPGPTRNPHDLTHTPGGSSSGSAAAVANRMLPLALGTQTAGSIIRPATYCGVVGYKPSPLPDLAGLQKAVMAFEMARALSHERVQHAGRLSAPLRALSDDGLAIPGAQHALHLAQAPVGTDATGDPLYCRGWTLLGLPCIRLPFTTGRRGLPVGLQRVGRFAGDHRLLAVAQWVHERLTR